MYQSLCYVWNCNSEQGRDNKCSYPIDIRVAENKCWKSWHSRQSGRHWSIRSSLSLCPGVTWREASHHSELTNLALWHHKGSGILVVVFGEATRGYYIQQRRNLWVQKSRNRDHSACWGSDRDHHA